MASAAAIKQAIKVIEGAQSELRELRREFAKRRAEWQESADVSEVFRATKLEDLKTEFLDQVHRFAGALERARRTLDEPPPVDARSAADQLLDEQRESRAWTRTERLLASGASLSDLVRSAGADRDLVTLRALRAELPSYLAATHPPGSTAEERLAVTASIIRLIDLATIRALPDGPDRTRLAGRLLWAALGPIAEQELAYTESEVATTGRITSLENALAVRFLAEHARPVLEAVSH